MTPSTYFGLMAEFQRAHIPITEIGAKYFGFDERKAKSMAADNKYPFPVFRLGSNKTTWMVAIEDFAAYLDKVKEKAKAEYKAAK
ncbi:MAG: pyocin activator PrtN family protein [Methylobacter sp.]